MPAKTSTRQVIWLVALLAALAVLLVYQVRQFGPRGEAGRPAQAGQGSVRVATARDRAAAVPEPSLSALRALASAPEPAIVRNPFRDRPVAPPVLPPSSARPGGAVAIAAQGPPLPPPPPPITLKLVAIIRGAGKPMAALSDGRDVFYGREGEVVEGRYKIIKINVESIDISYVDGRGQRRLGLTG
jgi:hypothetical protein